MTAQSQLSSSHTSITQAMPAFLSIAQELDLAHATALKEALVKYGTISADLGRERMEMGERILNAVLAIDDQAEMQDWALKEGRKAGGGRIGGEPLPTSAVTDTTLPPIPVESSPAPRPQPTRQHSSSALT